MNRVILVLISLLVAVSMAHPTIYKYNDNKMLEPDLIPVSSTVIPIPVYKVSYGLNVAPNGAKVEKPQGPISLITVHTKKKAGDLNKKKGV